MTSQFSDHCILGEHTYTIVQRDEGALFDPKDHGITPFSFATCCWRGYTVCYAVVDAQLVLDRASIGVSEPPPILNGVLPATVEDGELYFGHKYRNVNLPINYSGTLVLAREWIGRFDRGHHGYARALEFEVVKVCQFEGGRLINMEDQSAFYENRREELIEDIARQEEMAQLREERRFSNRYRKALKSISFLFTRKKKTMATRKES